MAAIDKIKAYLLDNELSFTDLSGNDFILLRVEYNLVVAPEFNPLQLDVNAYFNEDGVPSKSGAETVTRVLLASLAGNVRYMHDNKMMSAEEHLIYIIKELKRHLKNIDGVEGIDKPLSIITTQTKG